MTSGKESPRSFNHFGSKNHWKRTILSRVMILFGFSMVNRGYPWSRLTMDIHGRPWISMVNLDHGYPRLTMEKPKSIITRLRIVRFQWFLDPKWLKLRGDSFPDVKRSKFLYIWWVCTIFCFLILKKWRFFQRSKIRKKSLGVPTAPRPTPGGIIWYLMVP